MKTRTQLAQDALEEIERAGVDEAPSAEDLQTTLDRMDTAFADLLSRNVILQPIGDEIEEDVYDHLVSVMAKKIAAKFGLAGDANIAAAALAAEGRLRTISRINRGTRKTLRVDVALRPLRNGRYSTGILG